MLCKFDYANGVAKRLTDKDITTTDDRGHTLLHEAAAAGAANVVLLLLHRKADPDPETRRSSWHHEQTTGVFCKRGTAVLPAVLRTSKAPSIATRVSSTWKANRSPQKTLTMSRLAEPCLVVMSFGPADRA